MEINITNTSFADREAMDNLLISRMAVSRDQDYKDWLDNSPFGKSIAKGAFLGDKLVGYVKAVPVKMNDKGKEYFAYISTEAVVDQQYEDKDIYKSIAKEIYDEMRENGANLRYEYPIFGALIAQTNKLNATYIEDISVYIKIFSFKKHLTGRMKNKFMAGIMGGIADSINKLKIKPVKKENSSFEYRDISFFNIEHDEFWNLRKLYVPMSVDRCSEYLNWRFFMHPEREKYKAVGAYDNNELVGYVIYKREEKTLDKNNPVVLGHIMDLVGINDAVANSLLDEVERILEQDADFLTFWSARGGIYSHLGGFRGYRMTKVKIAMVGQVLNEDIDAEETLRSKNWYIMPIDSDIF
ncbi:MAG: GNAT family N-acetyltransferase [Tissierellia bacterium]|nr:GNAT family N-acetyltransferase [Tissierellia bacterium]